VNINKDAESDPGVKVSAAAWFKRMEDGVEDTLKNWHMWREHSVKKYVEEYERLNFDVYSSESKVGKKWRDYALEQLSDVEGANLVDREKWKLGKAVPFFLASYLVHGPDGTSIYFTRDVGGAIERYDQHKMLSSKQDLHMTQFIKMLDLMSFPWASSMEHVNYGVVVGHPKRDRRLPRPDHP